MISPPPPFFAQVYTLYKCLSCPVQPFSTLHCKTIKCIHCLNLVTEIFPIASTQTPFQSKDSVAQKTEAEVGMVGLGRRAGSGGGGGGRLKETHDSLQFPCCMAFFSASISVRKKKQKF